MCIGSKPATQPLPPVAALPPTMADPAVDKARTDSNQQVAAASGLGGTTLNVNLGGQGGGAKKMGAAR